MKARTVLALASGLAMLVVPVLYSGCAGKPVTVGFIAPLTGTSAPIGLGGRNGFLLAFGSGSGAASGSIGKVRLLVRDDANNPTTCLAAMQELKAEGCSLVVLGTTSQAASLALPWAAQNDILVVSPTVSTPVQGMDNSLFVRINLSSVEYGKTIAREAVRHYGARSVAVVGDSNNTGYVEAVRSGFWQEFGAAGGDIPLFETFDSREQGYASALADRLVSTGCDGLLIIAASSDVVLLAKQIEKLGRRPRLYLPPWPLTPDLLDNGGTAVEGALAVSIADLEFSSPRGSAFAQAYLTGYGEKPGFTALFGYEAAMILRSALAARRGGTPAELRHEILSRDSFDGLQGHIRFDAEGNALRSLFVYTIEARTFRRLN